MKKEVWMYFNSDLFLVETSGDLISVYANDYLIDVLVKEILQLSDILFLSKYLGDLE